MTPPRPRDSIYRLRGRPKQSRSVPLERKSVRPPEVDVGVGHRSDGAQCVDGSCAYCPERDFGIDSLLQTRGVPGHDRVGHERQRPRDHAELHRIAARDGLLPKGLSRVSANSHTPFVAIIAFAPVGAVLAVLGSYDRLSNMAVFGNLLFYALNAIVLLRWRNREPEGDEEAERRRRWIPVAFLAGILWLFVTLIVRGSVEIGAALALMGLGLPVFAYMRYRRAATATA
jgi:hypothetical protein